MIKFADNLSKDNKDTNKIPNGRNDKNSSKKNSTPNTNTISEIQGCDSDQSIGSDNNKNDSMGWRSLQICNNIQRE